MDNKKILKEIENLKGRRAYVEKKAAKLGFDTLYEYFEHKIRNSTIACETNAEQLERFRKRKSLAKKVNAKKNKSCGCC